MSPTSNDQENKAVGKPIDRVDGRLKVTAGARYAAEFPLPNLAHAVLLQSTIARGRIKSIDTKAAEKAPGVIALITHLNAMNITIFNPKLDSTGEIAQAFTQALIAGLQPAV